MIFHSGIGFANSTVRRLTRSLVAASVRCTTAKAVSRVSDVSHLPAAFRGVGSGSRCPEVYAVRPPAVQRVVWRTVLAVSVDLGLR